MLSIFTILSFVVAVLLEAHYISAVDLFGSLSRPGDENQLNVSFPNGAFLTLTGETQSPHRSFVCETDLTFSFYDVDVGTYRLDVISRDWNYEPLRVNVDGLSKKDVSITSYFSNTPVTSLYHLKPTSPMAYYQPKESFSIFAFIKSPMVLMMLVAIVLGFFMKAMIGNMSPEELEEMKQMQSGFTVNNILKKVQQGQLSELAMVPQNQSNSEQQAQEPARLKQD